MRIYRKKTNFAKRAFCLLSIIIVFVPNPIFAIAPTPDPEYIEFIQQKINSYIIYPQEAKNNNWEGVVKVNITIADDGRVKLMEIAESSGYPLLDAAAMLAIKDASPYPFPDVYTGRSEFELIVPVTYKGTKSSQSSTLDKFSPQNTITENSGQTSLLSLDKRISAESKQQTQELTPQGILFPPSSDKTLSIEKKGAKTNQKKQVSLVEELQMLIEIALKNNQPTQVAKEEVELAKIKIAEANRNLFPNVKISAYNTDGEVYKVEYTEREAKIQIDQPLFHGGALLDTIEQAKVNLEIRERDYERLKLDVKHKTETAYYNLVAAKMHLKEKEFIFKAADDLLQKIEKLNSVDMVIPLEVNSSKSWFEQIKFHIKSIKQDLYMAETTLTQVLNTQGLPKTTVQFLDALPLDLHLDTCIQAALTHRPEIYLSELRLKFNDYAQKIIKDREKVAINFEGSYGHYEGAYKTEKMRDSDNWYAGIKAVKPFGANTANASFTNQESQPRFGQTSPTKTMSVNAEVSILDNFKRLSDKKQSDIDLLRSLSDMNESAKTIAFEVQDAFLNYQKSVLQLNTAESEMKFRVNEAEVIKMRAMAGETSLSNAMEAIYGLSDAQTKYIQALAGYYIAIANLKKATGYGIRL